jgi:hypothetical protein
LATGFHTEAGFPKVAGITLSPAIAYFASTCVRIGSTIRGDSMMRFLAASLLVVCAAVPTLGAAQTVLPERFGVCWLTSVPLREHWVSPMFEHDMQYGELFAETERVSREFRDVVRASAPKLAADEQALCTFKTTAAEGEAEHKRMRKLFRFSGVDTHDVPWAPSAAPAPVAPVAVAAPAPAIPAAPVQPAAMRQDTGDIEGDYWSRIVDSKAADDFDDYLKAFPKGRHAPLARLEAKRLRRGDRVGAVVPATPIAATPLTPQVDPTLPIDDAVRAALTDASFHVPDGHGVALEHAGKRVNTVGTVKVPVAMINKVHREVGNLCRLEQQVTAGDTEPFVTTGHGLTWAGLLPLSITSRMASKYAIVNSSYHTTALSHQGEPLFPLVEGTAHAFSLDALSVDPKKVATVVKLELSCRVGATGPASAIIAGTAGEQTELQCRTAYPTYPTLPPQDQVYHWFSEAGCFVQDPSRPL